MWRRGIVGAVGLCLVIAPLTLPTVAVSAAPGAAHGEPPTPLTTRKMPAAPIVKTPPKGKERGLTIAQCWKWNYNVINATTRCTKVSKAMFRVRPTGRAGQWEVLKGGSWSWIPYRWSPADKALVYSHALDLSHGGSWPTFAERGPLRVGEYRPLPGAFPLDELEGADPALPAESGGSGASVTVDPPRKSPLLSADGRYVAYVSGQRTATPQVRRWDTVTGEDVLVSVNMSGEPSVGKSYFPTISEDGSLVAFISSAGDLVPGDMPVTPSEDDATTNYARDVLVRDMRTGVTRVGNFMWGGAPGGSFHGDLLMTPDGRYLVFKWRNPNGWSSNVYRSDLMTGTTVRVDPPNLFDPSFPYGAPAVSGISDSGRFIGYGMWWPASDHGLECVVTDMETGRTINLSVMPDGQPYPGQCSGPVISGDGSIAIFNANLVEGEAPACNPICRSNQHVTDLRTEVRTPLDGQVIPGRDVPLTVGAMTPDARYIVSSSYLAGECVLSLSACPDHQAAQAAFVIDSKQKLSTVLRPPLFGPGELSIYNKYPGPGPVVPRPNLDYRSSRMRANAIGISRDGSTVLFMAVLEDPRNGRVMTDILPIVSRVNWESTGVR